MENREKSSQRLKKLLGKGLRIQKAYSGLNCGILAQNLKICSKLADISYSRFWDR